MRLKWRSVLRVQAVSPLVVGLVLGMFLGPAMPASAAGGALTAGSALPDTVLAQVGAHRLVSVADFRRAWDVLSPPLRPDSLTPQSAREFLQLLAGKEALAEAALKESWVWTRAESARLTSTRDRLVLQVALEAPLEEARSALERAGQPADGAQAGVAARDSAIARMGARFDETLVERLARTFAAVPRPPRDSGLFAQLRVLGMNPAVDPRDWLAVVAYASEGDYRVGDLMAWWRNLNPLARPRVESPDQMRDVVKNGLFERKLRRMAATLGLEHRADIAAELARQREYFAVTHLVNREVYDALPMDSLTLLRFYGEHPDDFAIPERVRALRLVLPTRADAGRMAARLREAAAAESLAAMARRQSLGYSVDLTADRDSVLFAHGLAAGPGAVVGPDSVSGGWAVARIEAIVPPRRRTFEEARALVEHQWYGLEGERRMAELMDRLRHSTRVRVNERALARLARR